MSIDSNNYKLFIVKVLVVLGIDSFEKFIVIIHINRISIEREYVILWNLQENKRNIWIQL